MSLEECRRLAEEKREKGKTIRKHMRLSSGEVEGEKVVVCFSKNLFSYPRKPFIVFFSAYGEVSIEYFKKKESAERYFEELTQKYGLKEEEKKLSAKSLHSHG